MIGISIAISMMNASIASNHSSHRVTHVACHLPKGQYTASIYGCSKKYWWVYSEILTELLPEANRAGQLPCLPKPFILLIRNASECITDPAWSLASTIQNASYVPPSDMSNHDPLPPNGSNPMLSGNLIMLICKVLSIKYAISLVCRLWRTIVVEFYDFIVWDTVHIPGFSNNVFWINIVMVRAQYNIFLPVL